MSNTPKIVQYFRNGGSLENLQEQYGIYGTFSKKFPNLLHLKYDQIEASKNPASILVKECRGIILDVIRNYEVIAYPFNRFFNDGESHADKLNFDNLKIFEKLDGSLTYLYHYNNEWHVATSGNPDAAGQVGEFNFTFSELFWRVFDEMGYSYSKLSPCFTYIFELMTPYNQVVVHHSKNSLKLIGVRRIDTYEEYDVEYFSDQFEVVQRFNYSYDNLHEIVNKLSPVQSEGFVVVDDKFQRLKIKSLNYVSVHRLRSTFSIETAIDLIKAGETSEIEAYFPELKDVINDVKNCLDKWAKMVDEDFQLKYHYSKISRKEFALQTKECSFQGALFGILDGKYLNGTDWISKMPSKNLAKMIKIA